MATWPIGDRLEIVFEQPCPQYRIDTYLPALRIAIEVDEPHHDRQAQDDPRRQADIEG